MLITVCQKDAYYFLRRQYCPTTYNDFEAYITCNVRYVFDSISTTWYCNATKKESFNNVQVKQAFNTAMYKGKTLLL